MKKERRKILSATRDGSALIWSMVVVMVLLILISIIASITTTSYKGQVDSQVRTQAYYTARTVSERLTNWLSGARWAPRYATILPATPIPSDSQKFIKNLVSGNGWAGGVQTFDSGHTILQSYSKEDLGGNMGTAEARISVNYNDADADRRNRVITIETTGHFGNDSSSITTQLFFRVDSAYMDMFENAITSSSAFSIAATTAKATELNALAADSNPSLQGLFYTADSPSYVHTNEWNNWGAQAVKSNGASGFETKLERVFSRRSNSYIGNSWPSFAAYIAFPWVTDSATNWPNPTVFQTFHWDADNASYTNVNAAVNYYENDRTFVAPSNGRMTFNPLRSDGTSGANADSSNNTRLVDFTVSGTAGKDVLMRLGGDTRNIAKYNSWIGIDFVDQNTGADTMENKYVEYLPNGSAMNVTLGVSSNNYNKATPDFDSDLRQALWYPQKWSSCTIFTQNSANANINGGIDARLMFGPFQHGYETGDASGYYDYWGWGSYVANPNYGQSKGDAYKAFPEFTDGAGKNKRGMPVVPVYYGNNFNMYLLDNVGSASNQANAAYKGNLAWIQQGVSILNERGDGGVATGNIYSVRGLTIGGMPRRTASNVCADDAVRSSVGEWIHSNDPYNIVTAIFAQSRFSTLIYNTDIVLTTPNGKATPRTSSFKRALNYADHYMNNATNNGTDHMFWRKDYSRYYPKTKIIGGDVYVGAGQTLTIQGGTQLYKRIEGKNETSGTNSGKPVSSDLIATGEYNMYIEPDSMTIVGDATVNIEASQNTNVKTDIFVSGTLTLSAGSNTSGNIIVEQGGSVTANGGQFDGSIYVKNGGTLKLNSGTQITGDVYCAGALTINGAIVVNHPAVMFDNPKTLANEARPDLHGIYIYNSPVVGVGSLTLTGNASVSGDSGKIHDFAGYPGLVGQAADTIFCNDRDDSNNECMHWEKEIGTWRKQGSANE